MISLLFLNDFFVIFKWFFVILKWLFNFKLDLWSIVNNAGILSFLPIEWGPPGIELFEKQMQVNALGQVRVTKAFLPLLRQIKNSRIVNVTSYAGQSIVLK